ncbi:M20 family metallopeptidase [Geodermatophilus sp. CPCC 206100]|uniref:M20 family metallopeptidase n=1 Tax=Geodermatophilus sp. CPCC 206100 TaxID=3020054 RepID=UPI003AFFABB9
MTAVLPARVPDGELLAQVERLVMTESPSEDLALTRACAGVVGGLVSEVLGERPQELDVDGRPHLLLRSGAERPVLLLAHLDTVWPAGTTADWPFSVAGDTATGPGVFDMKAGLVQGLHAVRTAGVAGVDLLVTSDEEIGSPTSRSLIEREARRARAVLVLEPSADGAPKTARKGVSMYRLLVTGRASHAGLEPEAGVNALVELAAQVAALAALGDPAAGTTVTPTVARAGTTTNTVPATAETALDVRAWTAAEQQRVDDALRALTPTLDGAALQLLGGVNRPPLEAAASTALMALAARCAAELGFALPDGRAVGGGSDGNFTAGIGVPTLDGLGAVGAGAHARGERVSVPALAERTALVARLLQVLTNDDAQEDTP